MISAVFSDFVAPLQNLSSSPRPDPEFLAKDTGQIFNFLWLRIVHFDLGWLLTHD